MILNQDLLNAPLSGVEGPVLFLHGGHSNCHETLFHKGFDHHKFQLITPSRPGYGKTPLADHLRRPKEAADLIVSMLDALGISSIVAIGISAGGLTAIELAAACTHRVEKLLLISAVTKSWLAPGDPLYNKAKYLFSPSWEAITWALFRGCFRLAPRSMTEMLFQQLSTRNGEALTQAEILEIEEMVFKQRSGKGFLNDLDQDIDESILGKITCPTLILHSENDKSVDRSMAQFANERIHNSRLITYDNKWGHLLWAGKESEQPIRDVAKFLNE